MATVNLALTYQSLVTGTVTNPANIYSDDNAYAVYSWSSASGARTARYGTDFATAVPAGATVTGWRLIVRALRSNTTVLPVPTFRWGTSGGSTTLADYDLTTSEAEYVYPPSGVYTGIPDTWSTIDIGMNGLTTATGTGSIDQFIVEVTYIPASVGGSYDVQFFNEVF